MKGIQVCSNEGPRPFPRGENYEIVKIENTSIKFKKSSSPEPTELGTMHPRVKGFKFVQMKAPSPFFSKGDNYEIAKIH